MALVKCKECGTEVSDQAAACPKCGAKPPQKTSPAVWILGALVLFGVFKCTSVVEETRDRRAGDAKLSAAIAATGVTTAPTTALPPSLTADERKVIEASAARRSETAKANAERQARCAASAPTLVASARAMLKSDKPAHAVELLNECADISTDPAVKVALEQARKADAAKMARIEREAERRELAQRRKEGVHLGMTADEVLKSMWGRPQHVNRTTTAGGSHEQWVYPGGYLYLENGVLTAIQN